MPEELSNSAYNDIDELLTKPPSVIVKYGSATLLFLLIILCTASIVVKYDDGLACVAYIKADSTDNIRSPAFNCIIEKSFISKDTILRKGDTLLLLKKQYKIIDSITDHITPQPESSQTIVAPLSGKITCQRILKTNDAIDQGTLLFAMAAGQIDYKIKIALPENNTTKINLGQRINISIPGYNKDRSESIISEVISLPYYDTANKKTFVDATVQFKTKSMPYIFGISVPAYIITGQKSLAAAFMGW